MESGFVKTSIDDSGLTTITFGCEKHNPLTFNILLELTKQINKAGDHPDTKLILLQSAGDDTFCAGAHYGELAAIEDEASGKKLFSGLADVINAMRKSSKLILGRVQGKAVGGGVGLIAACDYVFATEKAAVKLSEVSISIGPFVIAPAVERKVGISALTKLTLNPNTFFDVQWAKRHDLFHTVKVDSVQMDKAINEFSERLTGKNQDALTALKRTLWHDTKHWDELLYKQAGISGKLAANQETKALLTRIREKSA